MSAPRSREELVAAAHAQGLLPADAVLADAAPERPWPVLLLTALGAWLAAVPLLAAVGTLFFSVAGEVVSVYLFGVLLLAAAVVVLRSRSVPLFVEQLAVPMLLAGGGCLAMGLFRDMPIRLAAAMLCLLALAIAMQVKAQGQRVLLGFIAAGLAGLVFADVDWERHDRLPLWWAAHVVFGLWIALQLVQRRVLEKPGQTRLAAALEPLATGWCLAALLGLAWFAGMSFLVGGVLGSGAAGAVGMSIWQELNKWGARAWGVHAVSAALAVAAAWVAAQAWPSLRRPAMAGVALLVVALAACLSSLGAALLATAWLAATARWRLAAAAAATSAWIVGSFYYLLQWTLVDKALLLLGVGLVLGVLAWTMRRPSAGASQTGETRGTGRGARIAIAASALLTLAVAGVGLRQNEALIAEGAPVFVELAPVDPRSLMQGDYMQLRFHLPADAQSVETLPWQDRPVVLARRDARGIASAERLLREGETPGADQLRLQLTPKDGRWALVTDAWFFKEGDAALWEKARYGEFRVRPDGRALLVGMADAELKPILRP
jgi:uncharacterized membrane-anchored protein